MAQGLSDWEWDQLKMVTKPETVRKRFREELECLERFGDFLAFSDYLLAHLLAYAWKDFYRVALVCKRFHCVTKTRAYWSALARRFFHGKIPGPILEQVNFFHRLPEEKPAYTYLQGIFKKQRKTVPFIRCDSDGIILFYSSDFQDQEGVFELSWFNDRESYAITHYQSVAGSYDAVLGTTQCSEFFKYPKARKLVWTDMKKADGDIVSIHNYCEFYDPERNQTWYGQPGIITSKHDECLKDIDMMPGPLSWGVWK